eukprot:scaffold39133_cov33-Prasinocladus_malaysianus.AAC.1
MQFEVTLHSPFRFGRDRVVASDVRTNRILAEDGPFVYCDVQDKDNLARIMLENGITTVVHLATLLSGLSRNQYTLVEEKFRSDLEIAGLRPLVSEFCFLRISAIGERNPQLALKVNTSGIQ